MKWNTALLLGILFFTYSVSVVAQTSICATVEIQIRQELTLERQAFEASLVIENTLTNNSLENIEVIVNFEDENQQPVIASSNPNNTSASFFIRINSMEGVSDVAGNGSLGAEQTARITWLIIPAPGSGGNTQNGNLYFVGASFNYTLDGIEQTLAVAPDIIYVRPMPLLSLDYFLPEDVFADNPLTEEVVEPIEPFTFGVRITNNGSAVANDIKIESAQPEIVENLQGLLIDFELLSSFVQNEATENSLRINFGDIDPNQAKVGRWLMSTTLSGQFTEFTAEYSHSDELGGELTSLLEEVNTHTLLHDVLVDIQGRDSVKDFLAQDIDAIRVYESNSTTTVVANQSDSMVLGQGADQTGRALTIAPTAGFAFAQMNDPFAGNKQITRVIRSDGKDISQHNVWFSKSYDRNTEEVSYHLNLFDVNTQGSYQIFFSNIEQTPQPPVIQFIPLRVTNETQALGFLVTASDLDSEQVSLIFEELPSGAQFSDNGNGTGTFRWTPSIGQAGRYNLRLIASDGTLQTSSPITIQVNTALDTDGDGLLDEWEIENFGDLDQGAEDDPDNDGLTNLDEFELNTDPNTPNRPSAPTLLSPINKATVTNNTPVLLIGNSQRTSQQTITYEFELFTDPNFTNMVDAYYAQPEDISGQTSWIANAELEEDTRYYWQARASDGYTQSDWSSSEFLVNIENQRPNAPQIISPADGSTITQNRPRLRVANSIDPDGDNLIYMFKVYSDATGNNLLFESPFLNAGNTSTQWQVPQALTINSTYYWQAAIKDSSDDIVSSQLVQFTVSEPPPSPEPPEPEVDSQNSISSFLTNILQLLLFNDRE